MKGVRIEPLPLSTSQLTEQLPRFPDIQPRDYLGCTLLSIEHKVEPTLYQPNDEHLVKTSWHTEVPGVSVPTACHAFALETDTHAEVAFSWNDYLELKACARTPIQSTWHSGSSRFKPSSYTNYSRYIQHPGDVATRDIKDEINLSIEENSLRTTVSGLAAKGSEKSQITAARWVSSKDPSSSLEDRFIDLRIGLETLYLQDFDDKYRGEMRFRLALIGAWHLGSDVAERMQVLKTLRDAYDVASGVVHSGQINPKSENRMLLRDGQRLCRIGLLRLLQEGPPKDWWELILGGEIPVQPT